MGMRVCGSIRIDVYRNERVSLTKIAETCDAVKSERVFIKAIHSDVKGSPYRVLSVFSPSDGSNRRQSIADFLSVADAIKREVFGCVYWELEAMDLENGQKGQ